LFIFVKRSTYHPGFKPAIKRINALFQLSKIMTYT
jgi:hypothetical protein